MSSPDIQGNVLNVEGVNDWKVVALFAISRHSKCHGPNVFCVRIIGLTIGMSWPRELAQDIGMS